MKFFQGSMTALVLAISLAACSDNKNQNTASDTASNIVAKATEVSPNDVAADASFKQLLSYIPADTAYLFTNKNVMPKDVIAFHLQRSKQALQVWVDFLEKSEQKNNTAALSGGQSSEEPSNESEKKIATQAADHNEKSKDFIIALLKDLQSNMSVDKIADTGMKADGHSVIYGVDLAPIFRFDITSQEAIKKTIKRAEETSGYTLEWEKCGNNDCIELSDKTLDSGIEKGGIMIVLHDDQVAGGLFTTDNKQAVIEHLTGKSKPERNYPVAQWNTFLTDNKYAGYGDGYVNLKKVYDSAEKIIIEQEKKRANGSGEDFDEKSFKACSALVNRHIEHVPEAVFGIKAISQNSMNYEVVLKTSPAVSTAISAIPNSLAGMQQATNPVFDFGLNINFDKLREGLTRYTQFLIKAADEVHCDVIKPNEIRKSMGGFTMATMMGVNQFKAIYVSVNDLKMDADGKPEKIDFYASVFADQPTALLQMLGMVNPAFATISVPKDGTPIKLPEGLVPPNPTGVNPEIYVSQKDNLLNVMVGDTKPDLKSFKTNSPVFFWNTLDSKRYYQTIGNVMKNTPSGNSAEDKESQKAIELMTKMSGFTGKVQTQIGADNRGVVINYAVEYDK